MCKSNNNLSNWYFVLQIEHPEKVEEFRQLCISSDYCPTLIEKMKSIIDLGIDVNAEDEYGRNALHNLCQKNSTSNLITAMELLIEMKIDVNAENNDGQTPLHYLSEYNSSSNLLDAISLLIKQEVDVNAKSKVG